MADSSMEVSTSAFDERLARVVAQVPGWDDGKTTWKWLSGGGAHKNFRVIKGDGVTTAVVKLWNLAWEGLGVVPPSAVPMLNTVEAGRIGVGAGVIAIVDDPLAIMIEFVPGRTIDLKAPGALKRAVAQTRRLHDSGICFRRDFNPFAEARVILAASERRGMSLPDDHGEVTVALGRIERALDMRPRDFVPSHNDLYSANMLEQPDGTIRLLDYDLSGNSDRCYDLGLMTTFESLDADETSHLTELYFGGFDKRMRARIELFAIAADYAQAALYATAQAVADANDDYDYAGYLRKNWDNICRRLDDPAFGNHLADA